jgi:DNA-binding response OmpR family regulator
MTATLLIVEDEPAIVEILADNLRQDDHRVVCASSIGEALGALKDDEPDIALIDVGLPDGSGFDLCRNIRNGQAGDSDIGIIMLTARAEAHDRVRGFDRGADDYVVKPFHYPELLGRINALAARLRGRRSAQLAVGPIRVDVSSRVTTVNGTALILPAKEFELLAVLARDPTRVYPKHELLERVWGYRAGSTRTLDSHASRLRRRLEDLAGGHERYVINHWGTGYALVAAC